MTSVRGSDSIQASTTPIINKTMGQLLRFSNIHRNMTAEELNMAFGDLNTGLIPDYTFAEWLNIISFLSVFCLVGLIGWKIVEHITLQWNKDKMSIRTPINWFTTKYHELTHKEVLPITRPAKAKESPFVGPEPTPPALPSCPRLDGAERGQNVMLRVRSTPSFIRPQEETNTTTETRITIVTVVGNNGKPPLPRTHNP
jgi:hypothetical protein